MKCKLSQPRESTKMSDIYNFYFDFINKVSLYSKKSDDDDSKEFDPLSWNLSNGGGKKSEKATTNTEEKRKLRNKNKWRKEHRISLL